MRLFINHKSLRCGKSTVQGFREKASRLTFWLVLKESGY